MIQETAAATGGTQRLERRFEGPLQAWEIIFLIAFAAGILVAAAWQSSKSYFNNDELLTAVLAANPSFSEMWNTIRHGGELNPPLFFVMEWLVAHTWGTSEFALRSISAVSVALAGCVLFFTVRPLTGPRVAALAVALVMGLSRQVFGFSFSARYYGPLLLLVSLAALLAMRFNEARPARRPDYVLIFLTHCAMVYLHLYGLIYSGVVLAAMVGADWLRRKPRWALYASVVAAWVAFGAWIPSLRQQLKSVSGGVFTPPGFLEVGFFLDQLSLETPMALVFLLVAILGGLALISARPCSTTEEVNNCVAPMSWVALTLLALALMSVPMGTWAASHKMYPPPYMLRYNFPIIVGWVSIVALVLLSVHRLPRVAGPQSPGISPWFYNLAWFGILAFCILFQPMRARKNPARPAVAFTDDDYGYKNLPIVFENSWYYLQRAFYGRSREYAMLIDHAAAEADPGWFTKNMEREFSSFYPHYHGARILRYDDLPDWPDGFLAVDDDYTRTFEWIFAHRPELKTTLLGTRKCDPEIFGEQRVWLVQKVPAERHK